MRYLFPVLFGIVLVTPFALRSMVGVNPQESYTNAPLRVVVITPHSEGTRREFQEAFAEWHQKRYGQVVHLDYRNYGGGASDIVKYFQASASLAKATGSYGVDLVWGGGDYLFDKQLREPGYLQPVELSPEVMSGAYPTPDIGGVPLYDPKGHWYGTALSSFGIVYNKKVLAQLGLPEPKQWDDLTDPRYRSWIVMADPTRSASANTAFMTIIERKMANAVDAGRTADQGWADGMGLIRLISSNARIFSDASSSVPKLVSGGDAAAGMAIDFFGRTEVEFVGEDRLGYVEPVEATIVNPDPIAVVRGAEHPEVAKRFIEFVLSEQGQRLWNQRVGTPGGPRQTALRRLPIRRSVYADTTYFADKVNPFEVAAEFNTRNDRKRTFPILGYLIQASCVDPLEMLRETRQEILASPRAQALEARLARFPYGEDEALRRMKEWNSRQGKQTAQLDLMRQWVQEFESEYAKLRAEAE